MLISYPALFYYSKDNDGYYVCIPDVGGSGTQGSSMEEALFMASDYLGIMASSIVENAEHLPKPSDINELSLLNDFPFKDDEELVSCYDFSKSFVSMVYVDLAEYMGSQELVKKTLSIPKWSNDLGVKLNLNFSKLLTEAIGNSMIK